MNRMELLKNKNIGKAKIDAYQKLFVNFKESRQIGLFETNQILENLNFKAFYNELLNSEKPLFIESILLRDTYLGISETSMSFIFTDDYL